MNTRRYPRSCDEAFGPYNRSSQCEIEPMPDAPPSSFDRSLPYLYVVALIGVAMALYFNNFH